MKYPIGSITKEPKDCIEDKCYFWELDNNKYRWMTTK